MTDGLLMTACFRVSKDEPDEHDAHPWTGASGISYSCPGYAFPGRVQALEAESERKGKVLSEHYRKRKEYEAQRDSLMADLAHCNEDYQMLKTSHDVLRTAIVKFHRTNRHPRSLAECPSTVCKALLADAVKAETERVAPKDATGATASGKGGLAASHELASAVSGSAAVKSGEPCERDEERRDPRPGTYGWCLTHKCMWAWGEDECMETPKIEAPGGYIVRYQRATWRGRPVLEVLLAHAKLEGRPEATPWKLHLLPGESATLRYKDGHEVPLKFIGRDPLPTTGEEVRKELHYKEVSD